MTDISIAEPPSVAEEDPATAHQWTAHLRRRAVSALPPEQLLPDRQPAFMASSIYVFGVLTLVSLAWVIVSGCILAIMARHGGTCRRPGTS